MSTSNMDQAQRRTDDTRRDRWGFAKVARRIAGFPKARRGMAATEFALLAPFMIALWLGSSELTQGISADRKLSLATSTLADLVTQQTSLTSDEMTNIMNATEAIMMPFSTADLAIEIVGIQIDDDGGTEVTWSATRGAGANPSAIGGSYDIPEVFTRTEGFLVVAHLRYAYTPPTMYVVTGSLELSDSFYLRPRRSDAIRYDQ